MDRFFAGLQIRLDTGQVILTCVFIPGVARKIGPAMFFQDENSVVSLKLGSKPR